MYFNRDFVYFRFIELDIHIIKKLSSILDSPEKIWERLADSLGLLSSMKSVLDQQESPATYLLSNIDVRNSIILRRTSVG